MKMKSYISEKQLHLVGKSWEIKHYLRSMEQQNTHQSLTDWLQPIQASSNHAKQARLSRVK
ncbi:MAG: hypothetical protein A2189_00895 [Paenibacillus sp. RIFOXYA1_FULL_44_5]|nr:MAG: hypothetical protein A2189_00895 [Paenibacillus sp. RIFOXYA1_FULL_44_5]